MADASFKKLLVKLGISTAEWKQYVQELKSNLRSMQDQSLKDFQARQSAQKKEIDLTQQQIKEQQKLKAEAEAMASFDKARAAWQNQQAAATRTKTQQTQLETAEIRKQAAEQQNLLRLEREKVALKMQQVRLEKQQAAEEERSNKSAERIPSAAGVAGLRGGVKAAVEVRYSKEQTVELEKQIAQEKIKLSVQEAQLKLMSMQEGVRKADVAALAKEITEERARLSLQESQLRMSQASMVSGAGGRGGGGGFIGGALMSIGGGLLGGGLPGMMAAGVAAGQALERIMEKLGETVRDVAHEMLEATGAAGQLREQFGKLTRREGEDPEEFLNKLRVATRGLVEDNTMLIRTANNFMQGPLRLQPAQIEKLMEMTVALARAQGQDATTAMNALSRAALTGYARTLQWTLGLTRAETSVKSLGKGVDDTAKQQLQLSMIMDAMARKMAEVGTPMTTMKDLFTQVHMVQGAFIEDLAYGFTHTQSFANGIQKISDWLMKITPQILDFAQSLGQKLGTAFAYLEPIMAVAVDYFKALWQMIKANWDLIMNVTPLGFLARMLDQAGAHISPFRLLLMGLSDALEITAFSIKYTASTVKLFADLLDAATSGSMAKAKAAFLDFGRTQIQNAKDLVTGLKNQWKLANEPLKTGEADSGVAGPHSNKPGLDPQVLAERRKLMLQIATEDAKTRLEMRKQELQDEQEAEKEKYDRGLETLQEYLTKERAIREASHQARLDEIDQEKKAKLAELALEAQGVKDPTTGKMVGGMDPGVYALKKQQIEKAANLQVEQEGTRHQKEMDQVTQQGLDDQLAAQRAYMAAVLKIQAQGVEEQRKILEDQFKSGELGADEYLDKRKALIEEEFNLTQKALDQEAAANKQNATETAKIRIQMVDAEIAKEKQLQDLEMQESDIRLQAIKTRYQEGTEILQAGIALNREQTGMTGGQQQVSSLLAMQAMTVRYIQQLQSEQDRLEQSGDKYTTDWAKISSEISKAVGEQQKLNTELAKAKDLAGPLGQMFGTIASELGAVLGPKTTAVLETMAKSLDTLSKIQTGVAAQMGGMGGMFKNVGSSFLDMFRKTTPKTDTIQTAQQIFEKGLKSASDKVGDFATGILKSADKLGTGVQADTEKFGNSLEGAVKKVLEFAAAVQSATDKMLNKSPAMSIQPDAVVHATVQDIPTEKSPLEQELLNARLPETGGGTATGGSSGMQVFDGWLKKVAGTGGPGDQFANKLKNFTTGLTGAVSAIGSVVQGITGAKSTGGGILSGGMSGMMFGAQVGGPIGAAIGGITGAVLGGVIGHKQEMVQQEMDRIKGQLQSIIDQLNDGTITMGNAIQQLRGERQQAISMLGGSKKGGKQLPAALQMIDDEIQKLVDQQKQTLDQMNQQIMELSQSASWQPIVSQLDEIINKYKEFASAAAGNAQAVADANTYLQESLQNYVNTMNNQLHDANTQAVQDAIKLIDLQRQKAQMDQQEALQEYDVLTQGVSARQRTTAMTKGEQIAQIKYQHDIQQQDLDEEIAVTQHKVDAEKQIFDLASTRIDLETQLLELQDQSTDKQMQQIEALQQAVGAITNAISTGSLATAVGPGGTLASGSQLLGTILSTLGLQSPNLGNVPGAPGTESAGQYITQYFPTEFYTLLEDALAADPNYLQEVVPALETAPGSAQRQQAEDYYRNQSGLEAAGKAQGLPVRDWIMYLRSGQLPANTPAPPPPGFELGGIVPDTGAAIVHAGEYVVPKDVFGKFITAVNTVSDSMTNFVKNIFSPGSGGTGFGGPIPTPVIPGGGIFGVDPVSTHQQIYDITTARVTMETNLAKLQQDTITMDMQRIAALQSLANSNVRMPVNSLEGAFSKLYEVRGRMGLGGFTRETL